MVNIHNKDQIVSKENTQKSEDLRHVLEDLAKVSKTTKGKFGNEIKNILSETTSVEEKNTAYNKLPDILKGIFNKIITTGAVISKEPGTELEEGPDVVVGDGDTSTLDELLENGIEVPAPYDEVTEEVHEEKTENEDSEEVPSTSIEEVYKESEDVNKVYLNEKLTNAGLHLYELSHETLDKVRKYVFEENLPKTKKQQIFNSFSKRLQKDVEKVKQFIEDRNEQNKAYLLKAESAILTEEKLRWLEKAGVKNLDELDEHVQDIICLIVFSEIDKKEYKQELLATLSKGLQKEVIRAAHLYAKERKEKKRAGIPFTFSENTKVSTEETKKTPTVLEQAIRSDVSGLDFLESFDLLKKHLPSKRKSFRLKKFVNEKVAQYFSNEQSAETVEEKREFLKRKVEHISTELRNLKNYQKVQKQGKGATKKEIKRLEEQLKAHRGEIRGLGKDLSIARSGASPLNRSYTKIVKDEQQLFQRLTEFFREGVSIKDPNVLLLRLSREEELFENIDALGGGHALYRQLKNNYLEKVGFECMMIENRKAQEVNEMKLKIQEAEYFLQYNSERKRTSKAEKAKRVLKKAKMKHDIAACLQLSFDTDKTLQPILKYTHPEFGSGEIQYHMESSQGTLQPIFHFRKKEYTSITTLLYDKYFRQNSVSTDAIKQPSTYSKKYINEEQFLKQRLLERDSHMTLDVNEMASKALHGDKDLLKQMEEYLEKKVKGYSKVRISPSIANQYEYCLSFEDVATKKRIKKICTLHDGSLLYKGKEIFQFTKSSSKGMTFSLHNAKHLVKDIPEITADEADTIENILGQGYSIRTKIDSHPSLYYKGISNRPYKAPLYKNESDDIYVKVQNPTNGKICSMPFNEERVKSTMEDNHQNYLYFRTALETSKLPLENLFGSVGYISEFKLPSEDKSMTQLDISLSEWSVAEDERKSLEKKITLRAMYGGVVGIVNPKTKSCEPIFTVLPDKKIVFSFEHNKASVYTLIERLYGADSAKNKRSLSKLQELLKKININSRVEVKKPELRKVLIVKPVMAENAEYYYISANENGDIALHNFQSDAVLKFNAHDFDADKIESFSKRISDFAKNTAKSTYENTKTHDEFNSALSGFTSTPKIFINSIQGVNSDKFAKKIASERLLPENIQNTLQNYFEDYLSKEMGEGQTAKGLTLSVEAIDPSSKRYNVAFTFEQQHTTHFSKVIEVQNNSIVELDGPEQHVLYNPSLQDGLLVWNPTERGNVLARKLLKLAVTYEHERSVQQGLKAKSTLSTFLEKNDINHDDVYITSRGAFIHTESGMKKIANIDKDKNIRSIPQSELREILTHVAKEEKVEDVQEIINSIDEKKDRKSTELLAKSPSTLTAALSVTGMEVGIKSIDLDKKTVIVKYKHYENTHELLLNISKGAIQMGDKVFGNIEPNGEITVSPSRKELLKDAVYTVMFPAPTKLDAFSEIQKLVAKNVGASCRVERVPDLKYGMVYMCTVNSQKIGLHIVHANNTLYVRKVSTSQETPTEVPTMSYDKPLSEAIENTHVDKIISDLLFEQLFDVKKEKKKIRNAIHSQTGLYPEILHTEEGYTLRLSYPQDKKNHPKLFESIDYKLLCKNGEILIEEPGRFIRSTTKLGEMRNMHVNITNDIKKFDASPFILKDKRGELLGQLIHDELNMTISAQVNRIFTIHQTNIYTVTIDGKEMKMTAVYDKESKNIVLLHGNDNNVLCTIPNDFDQTDKGKKDAAERIAVQIEVEMSQYLKSTFFKKGYFKKVNNMFNKGFNKVYGWLFSPYTKRKKDKHQEFRKQQAEAEAEEQRKQQEQLQEMIEAAYELFKVTSTATDDELKKAKNRLLKQFHPDMVDQSDKKKVEEFQEMTKTINNMYDLLVKVRKEGLDK